MGQIMMTLFLVKLSPAKVTKFFFLVVHQKLQQEGDVQPFRRQVKHFLTDMSNRVEHQNSSICCHLVELLMFNSAFGRQRDWLIPITSYSYIFVYNSWNTLKDNFSVHVFSRYLRHFLTDMSNRLGLWQTQALIKTKTIRRGRVPPAKLLRSSYVVTYH